MELIELQEKVKAYYEALERARNLHKDAIDMGENLRAKQCEIIFPELVESEDGENKRISKEITQFLKQNNGWNREWLDWLERQGEPFDDNIITRDDEILQAISIGLTDAEKDLGWSDFGGIPIEEIQKWLEKQGQKKSAIEMKSAEESLGIDSATYNKIVDEVIYGDQKLSDKVKPMFNVGEWVTIKQ